MKHISLGDAVERISASVTPDHIPLNSMVLGLEDVVPHLGILNLPTGITEPVRSNKNVFSAGDILFGKLRPTQRKVVVPELSGFCTSELLVLRSFEFSDTWFLWSVLRSDAIHDQIHGKIVGASLPRISPKQLLSLDIPWPSVDERVEIGRKAKGLLSLRTKLDLVISEINDADHALQASLTPLSEVSE
jgi:restriction endonuclease S subunit